jgi:hypothetical protein
MLGNVQQSYGSSSQYNVRCAVARYIRNADRYSATLMDKLEADLTQFRKAFNERIL